MKITWSLASADDPGFATREAQAWKTTNLGDLDLADSDTAVLVAQEVARKFFAGPRWADYIGDSNEETCFVEIHMPVEIKGRFVVDLERQVVAVARSLPA